MAEIDLDQTAAAAISTPASSSDAFFFDSADGAPKYKDPSGVVHYFAQLEWMTNFSIYNVQDHGVLPANPAATNTANIATLLAAASTGSTIFFPVGTYQFSAAIAPGAKFFRFCGSGQNSTFLLTTSATADLFALTDGNWYSDFADLGLGTTVTKSAGNMISTGTASGSGNVGVNVRRCTFGNATAGTNIFNGLVYSGLQSGNITVIEDCVFQNFANFGLQVLGNTTSNLSNANMSINGSTWQGQLAVGNAAAGINIVQCGSILLSDLDVIGCTNNLLINPATGSPVQGVFSVFAIDCYFDNSFGSSLLMTGTGNIERCNFVDCWFTTAAGAGGFSAVQINSTAAILPTGISFVDCNAYNTYGSSGTTFGWNVTGAKDVSIVNASIAGWTNGIAITPAGGAGNTTLRVQDSTIGPVGNIAANTTAILINAGASTYNSLLVQNSNLAGNTNSITDNSTGVTGSKRFEGTAGFNPKSVVTQPAVPASTVAVTNTTGVAVTVFVKGGTITAITVGGVVTGIAASAALNTAFPIPLAPMQTIAITFTAAPTWVWVGS